MLNIAPHPQEKKYVLKRIQFLETGKKNGLLLVGVIW